MREKCQMEAALAASGRSCGSEYYL